LKDARDDSDADVIADQRSSPSHCSAASVQYMLGNLALNFTNFFSKLQKPMNHGFAISDWSADLATAGAALAAAGGEREAAASGSHAAGGSQL